MLQEATCEEAVFGIGGFEFVAVVGAVEVLDVFWLVREIADFGGSELHFGGEFVGGHAGAEFVIFSAGGGVLGVDEVEEVACGFFGGGWD